jgi:hypothetical protein
MTDTSAWLPGMPLFEGREVQVFAGETLLSSPDVTFDWRCGTGAIAIDGLASTATEPLRHLLMQFLLQRQRVRLTIVVADPLDVYFLQPYVGKYAGTGVLSGGDADGALHGLLARFQALLLVDEPPFARYFDPRQLLPVDHPERQAMVVAPVRKPRKPRATPTRRSRVTAEKE